jgi:Secretion system C-terminal sorting domain
MKISNTLLIALLVLTCLNGTLAQSTFNVRLGFDYSTLASSVVISGESIIVTGPTIMNDGFNSLVLFYYEFTLDGNLIQSQTVGETDVEFFAYGSSAVNTTSASFVQSAQAALDDVTYGSLLFFDAAGNPIDTTYFLSPYNPEALDGLIGTVRPEEITTDSDGNLYLCSTIFDPTLTGNDFVVMKFTSDGEFVWQYIYATMSDIDLCYAMEHDGVGLVCAAYQNENLGDNINTKHFFRLIEDINEQPIVDWEFILDFPPAGNPRDLILENDGIVVCSDLINDGQTGLGPFLYKVDYNGNVLWQSEPVIGWYEDDQEYRRVIRVDDGYVCVASEFVSGDNVEGWSEDWDWNGILVKHDLNGGVQWLRRYKYIESCYESHFIYDLKATPDGGFVFCGESTDGCIDDNWTQEAPTQQAWVVKVDACGCLVPGCDEGCTVGLEELSDLEIPNFVAGPNPVSQYLNIFLSQDLSSLSGKASEYHFQIHDQIGRLITEFKTSAANTTYMLDVENFESGTYILSLSIDGIVVQSEPIVKL